MKRPRFPAEIDTNDTGLRFTDVLFGFVIRELFLSLNKWKKLDGYTRAHLIAGAVLVLGSYIGYRNSLKRGQFKIRFINLPLLKFTTDQAMVALYFAFAVAVPHPPSGNPKFPLSAELARIDANLLTLIFGLYLLWDLLSLAMHHTKPGSVSRYADQLIDGKNYPGVTFTRTGLVITFVFFLMFFAGRLFVDCHVLDNRGAMVFGGASALGLFLYRVAKDVPNWQR